MSKKQLRATPTPATPEPILKIVDDELLTPWEAVRRLHVGASTIRRTRLRRDYVRIQASDQPA